MFSKRQTDDRGEYAFSIVEVIIAMAVFSIVFLALMSTLATSMRMDAVTRERAMVANGLRKQVEILRALDFGDLYANFTIPGDFYRFEIEGVFESNMDNEATDEIESAAIAFLTDETGVFASVGDPEIQAYFQKAGAALGLPRDLDGDGLANRDVSTGRAYILLPVVLHAEWSGITGESEMNFLVLLADK